MTCRHCFLYDRENMVTQTWEPRIPAPGEKDNPERFGWLARGYWKPDNVCDACTEQTQADRLAWERAAAAASNYCAFRRAGIPRRAIENRGKDLAVLDERQKVLEAKLIEFIDPASSCRKTIFVYGPAGTGKTTRAQEALMSWIEAGRSGRCLAMHELLLRIRSTFSAAKSAGTTERDVIEEYRSTKFLILDDLGVERASEFAVETLKALIDHRINEGLRTVITSNFGPKELASHIAPSDDEIVVASRVLDRLKDSATFIELKGKSYRTAARDEDWSWSDKPEPTAFGSANWDEEWRRRWFEAMNRKEKRRKVSA